MVGNMIKPQTITEKMLFNTVKLQTKSGSGTGFFFEFYFIKSGTVPVIVTNKHVINNNNLEEVRFSLHTSLEHQPEDNINVVFKTQWLFHDKFDLCFCLAGPLLNKIKSQERKEIYFTPITEDLIWDNKKLEELSAIEDVVMIGYPIGLQDKINNLPLFRKGFTSSHPALDFNDMGIGVVDMACFPGSSGSPILILNENGYSDKSGNSYMGSSRVIFLGVLFSGPQFDSKGEIIIEDIPTQQKVFSSTPSMINLGYYIKASAILDFKPLIEKLLSQLPS